MKRIINVLLLITLISCTEQAKFNNQIQDKKPSTIVGGGCDGCELMYKNMPAKLSAIDTSEGWKEKGQPLIVEGTVYKLNGKITVPDVIIYYWQTDNNGLYSKTDSENTIHGHLRGWLKSDKNGNFKIYTVRPSPYPNDKIPAHIHFSIKEPGIANEYYIDDLQFDEDSLLTKAERSELPKRGGNGISIFRMKNDIQYIRRDIILGLNIPNYPK